MNAYRRISAATGNFIRSAGSSSKSLMGKMFAVCFAAMLMVAFTASTASAQTPPAFDFTTWFGYEPSAWVSLIITTLGAVIVLTIPFVLGVRILMRVIGWAKKTLAAR